MRPIDAGAVYRLFEPFGEVLGQWSDAYSQTLKMINDIPVSGDVELVVHGEWIVSYIDGIKQTECSACGVSFTTYDVYGWNYCPWCGAKMKGANDDSNNK